MANITVDLTDHSAEFLEAAARQIALGLEAIGGQAELFAKRDCPVDTGRLRNSITFATATAHGTPNQSGGQSAKESDYQRLQEPEPDALYVGTNVEYAADQEYFGRHPHFLRNSLTQHGEDFKKIMEAALKA